jgi:hypothetical protein
MGSVYHIMRGYVACVADVDNLAHRPHNHTLYEVPPLRFVFQVNSEGSKKRRDDGRLGASI